MVIRRAIGSMEEGPVTGRRDWQYGGSTSSTEEALVTQAGTDGMQEVLAPRRREWLHGSVEVELAAWRRGWCTE